MTARATTPTAPMTDRSRRLIRTLTLTVFLQWMGATAIVPIRPSTCRRVSVGLLVAWIIVLLKANQGQMYKLPFVGDLAEKQANAM